MDNWTKDSSLSSEDQNYTGRLGEVVGCKNNTWLNDSLIQDAYCKWTFDGITCWPPTRRGTVAIISCFNELNGVQYDSTGNASRLCFANSTWESSSNYSNCRPIHETHQTRWEEWNVNNNTLIIYYVGYTLSLVALTIALIIFMSFRDLQCLRNIFHINLMVTYILVIVTWIATAANTTSPEKSKNACIMVIFLYYFKGTNFFWMFVEGFYLHTLVVRTFSDDNIKFYIYCIIGWGIPAILVGIWTAAKANFVTQKEDPVYMDQVIGCPWLEIHTLDWILVCPILLVLFINVIFLVQVMWVLITKLRAIPQAESQQYRKAAKALLVLIPLLGVTYILVIAAPSTGVAGAIYAYARSILLSTQGLMVSVLYCFLNGEVKYALRKQWVRWQQHGSISCCYGRGSWSKSRTGQEELGALRKLDSRPAWIKGKRESQNTTQTNTNSSRTNTIHSRDSVKANL